MNDTPRTVSTRSTDPGSTAFSRAFPAPQTLQARYQALVQQQCQQCEDQGMSYLLYTRDPRGAGESLFPQGVQLRGRVQCMAPTGLDPESRLRVYFTEADRATVEDAVERHEARLARPRDTA
jgi:hypothetical protein